MATVRSVITGSLRKLQVVGGTGRRTPTNQEFADILPILLGLYRNLITAGTFGRLRDVVPRGDCIAGENQRIFRRYNEQQQILLPDMVSWCGSCGYIGHQTVTRTLDWAIPSTDYQTKRYGYHDGTEHRTIRDNSVVTIVDEFTGDILEAIYDGQRKLWFTLSDLDTGEELNEANEWSVKRLNDALNLEAPLSHRDLNGLVCLLATLIADDFGAEITTMIDKQAKQFNNALVGNYSTYKRGDIVPEVLNAPASAGIRTDFHPVPVAPVDPVKENLIQIDRAGTTPVSVSGTSESDLVFIVVDGFTLNTVNGVLYFTAANAASLGSIRHQWVLKDLSDDFVLQSGSIEAKGFAI
jgi:hypothetical protein